MPHGDIQSWMAAAAVERRAKARHYISHWEMEPVLTPLIRELAKEAVRRSKVRIAVLSGGCAIPSRFAARPKWSSSATAMK